MSICSRLKWLLQRLRSHINSDGLTETEHRRSSSAMDRSRPRPGANFSGHGSSASKSGGRHSSSHSSRGSQFGSHSPRNSRTSVSSVVVQLKQGNGKGTHAEEGLVPA